MKMKILCHIAPNPDNTIEDHGYIQNDWVREIPATNPIVPPPLMLYRNSNKAKVDLRPMKPILRRIPFDYNPISENTVVTDSIPKRAQESNPVSGVSSELNDQSLEVGVKLHPDDLEKSVKTSVVRSRLTNVVETDAIVIETNNDMKILEKYSQIGIFIDNFNQLLEQCQRESQDKLMSTSRLNCRLVNLSSIS